MALISCAECGQQISSQAKQCPNCGVQTALSNVTVEKTSKSIKALLLIGWIVFVISVLTALSTAWTFSEEERSIHGMWMGASFFSLLFLVIIYVRRWWHHG